MNIAIRLEGGLGDHILGQRFIPAIKEKYPNSKITVFSDTEGNSRSIESLSKIFPSFYDKYKVVGKRKSQTHKILSQFGEEIYNSDFKNLPDDTQKEINYFDKFYDLHIDGLKWLNYDFDWFKYFYQFPKPEITFPEYNKDGYILLYLYANPSSVHNVEQWYAVSLINKLSTKYQVVIITLPEFKDWYKEVFNKKNVFIETPLNLIEVFSLAKNCSVCIGTDSGIRCIPYHFSKPVFVLSKNCQQYGNPSPIQLIRWLVFKYNVFPINYNIDNVSQIIFNTIENQACKLYPYYLNDIDGYILNRKY